MHKECENISETILSGLNASQREAVLHDKGPALVLAGPGSGKTTVIVKRILYLIQVNQIPPEEILVVTFTKEAALSMQKRFLSGLQETYPVNFGTFHSIFYHILSDYDSNQYSHILTYHEKSELIKETLKDYWKSQNIPLSYDELKTQAEEYLQYISLYKNTKQISDIPSRYHASFQRIFQIYFRKCRKRQGIDFDDMVYECFQVLKKDAVFLHKWQERFQYYLIDEFQDINPIQYDVIKLLCKNNRNLFTVGDEDQSIYGFRGSSVDCIKRFVEEFGAKQMILNANYRSSAEIVQAADLVIDENRNRILQGKSSHAAGENADRKNSIHLISFDSKQQQLEYLVEKLKQFSRKTKNEEPMELQSCGVLFRTNSGMQTLATMLSKEEIPFVMKERTVSIYDHFIVRDIMAYLKLSTGDMRRSIFLQIMNKPLRYIKRESLGEMEMVDLALLKRRQPGITKEIGVLQNHMKSISKMPLFMAVSYICKACGYEKYLYSRRDAGEQKEEWKDILEFCKQDSKQYETLEEWEWAQDRSKEQLQQTKPTATVGIQLMTVHASKGLEFDKIFIPDCNEGMYPYGKMPGKESVEEERRIFYVAMTRAKKDLELLCVTGTKERPRYLSRFLNPILPHHQLSHQTHNCPNIHQTHP